MSFSSHGFSIGMERIDGDYYLKLKATGKLTHEDYRKISPLLDSTLKGVEDAKLNVLFDAAQLDGWELRAAWDDFKVGLKHGKKFEKIAVFGGKNWMENATKIASWFISGEIKFFEKYQDAIRFLQKK